ncbi:hypothetical protein ACFVHB_15625 [Kitasatospora sp. NPDC127111]|uniref:hypothetical protein n=1 Tax=Kitasatospora sp. NPDC127111 TaxID=3345363 RepID=UPI0036371985
MPYWQQLVLVIAGPAVSVVIGGVLAAWITRRAQDRRQGHNLRLELIVQMTDAASTLYRQTRQYELVKEQHEGRSRSARKEQRDARSELEESYKDVRVRAKTIEAQLEAYFQSDTPQLLWHSTIDLLTVRYLQLSDRATESKYWHYVGPQHSGLSYDELHDAKVIRHAYRKKLAEANDAVLRRPMVWCPWEGALRK